MSEFRFPEKKPRRPSAGVALGVRAFRPDRDEENLPLELMGIPVDSKEEARAGLALWQLDWSFEFHVQVFGGDVPGGQFIDFLVHTRPAYTPLYLQNAYWHRNRMRDDLAISKVRQRMGGWALPREVWDTELTSVQHAVSTMYQLFGRG